MRPTYLCYILFFFVQQTLYSQTYNVRDYGAIADGKTLNTIAIQKAIDDAYEKGGGQVLLDSGNFLSGTIQLKSNIKLIIQEKASLTGSTDPADYYGIDRWKALIIANKADSIKIIGGGRIDGRGDILALKIDSLFYAGEIDSSDYNFNDKRPRADIRPQLIEFVYCNTIEIRDIELHNAASWVQSYFRCQDLIVDNIRVESDCYWNNDGIDIIDTKNVLIQNSYFNCSDDAICLKSYKRGFNGPKDSNANCENIRIFNCTIRSSASAVKFGTASYRGFKKIEIKNIKVFDTFRSAIALEAIHSGPIEDVSIDSVYATNTGNAFFLRLGGKILDNNQGYFKNVRLSNIKVDIAEDIPDKNYKIRGPALPFFHNVFPSSITGVPSNRIGGIEFENIEINYTGGGNAAYANLPLNRLNDVPEQEGVYPEFSMFGELPAWGIYVRHAGNIKMKNVKLSIKKADYRPSIVLDDVEEFEYENLNVAGDTKEMKIYDSKIGAIELD